MLPGAPAKLQNIMHISDSNCIVVMKNYKHIHICSNNIITQQSPFHDNLCKKDF